jgi:hypothetical protein
MQWSSNVAVVICFVASLAWGVGKWAFGGLGIYGPHSPPLRKVDPVAVVGFVLLGMLSIGFLVQASRAMGLHFDGASSLSPYLQPLVFFLASACGVVVASIIIVCFQGEIALGLCMSMVYVSFLDRAV